MNFSNKFAFPFCPLHSRGRHKIPSCLEIEKLCVLVLKMFSTASFSKITTEPVLFQIVGQVSRGLESGTRKMFELVRELYGFDCPCLVSQHSYGSVTVNKEMLIAVDHPYANVDITAVRSTALTEIIEPVAVQNSIDSSSINQVLLRQTARSFLFLSVSSMRWSPNPKRRN